MKQKPQMEDDAIIEKVLKDEPIFGKEYKRLLLQKAFKLARGDGK